MSIGCRVFRVRRDAGRVVGSRAPRLTSANGRDRDDDDHGGYDDDHRHHGVRWPVVIIIVSSRCRAGCPAFFFFCSRSPRPARNELDWQHSIDGHRQSNTPRPDF